MATAGEDFLEFNFSRLTFPSDSSSGAQLCRIVEVLDDLILEPNQTFSIILSSTHSFVNSIVNQSLIIIEDNDCKLVLVLMLLTINCYI